MYQNLYTVLEKIKYKEQNSMCAVILKCVVWYYIGATRGYTKFPCFLCEWDSRARERHWSVTDWLKRKHLGPGTTKYL